MSVTYGFYNSIDHDRKYDAVQFASIFDGLITDGVYEYVKADGSSPFKVIGNGYKNQVTVDVGRAWFNHTWTYNDAKIVLTLPDATSGKYRCDAIVLDIDARQNVRENKITYVQGTKTTASEPSSGLAAFVATYKPDLIDDTLHKQIPLYYVERRPLQEENASPNIVAQYLLRIVGDGSQNPGCPYVANMLGSIDLQAHLDQWQSAWYEWFENQSTGFKKVNTDAFNAFVAAQRQAYNNWVDQFTTYTNQQHAMFESWREDQETMFLEWVDHLRSVLDSDAAGHLLMEIERLSIRVTPIEYGGTGNDQGYIRTGNIVGSSQELYRDPGDFATAEGVFTSASGIASHAEGGGAYSAGFQEAGFRCSNFVPSSSLLENGGDWEDTYEGETINYFNSNYVRIYHSESGNIKAAYIAYVLKNETTGEVLKRDVGCIGPNCINSDKYIGNLTADSSDYVTFYPYLGSSSNLAGTYRVRDIGLFKKDYNLEDSNRKYTYFDGNTLEFPDPIFYIDLPPTDPSVNNGYAELSGKLVSLDNTKLLESIFALDSDGDPSSVKLMWISDSRYGKAIFKPGDVLSDDDYNDWAWWYKGGDLEIGADTPLNQLCHIFAGFKEINHTRFKYFGNDGSYILGYRNINPMNKTIRVYFSGNKSQSEYQTEEAQLRANAKVYLSLDIGISIGNPTKTSGSYNSPDLYLRRYGYNHIKGVTNGDTYSLSYYYSVSTEDNVEYPIVWKPAGYEKIGVGYPTRAIGNYSHAEGYKTKASGRGSHAEGWIENLQYYGNDESSFPGAYGLGSHVEGIDTKATGDAGHAEGYRTVAVSSASHAEGQETVAGGAYSHAEGYKTRTGKASSSVQLGNYSHAEGRESEAWSDYSHAEGYKSIAQGLYSHAEGVESTAMGDGSHAGGGSTAYYPYSFVHGIFGFGGKFTQITSNTTCELNPGYHVNGGAYEIAANCSLSFVFNDSYFTTTDTALYRVYIITVTDGTHLEMCALICKNNTDNAPIKHIIKQSEAVSSFPFMTISGHTITIPTASVKRQVQVIRIM